MYVPSLVKIHWRIFILKSLEGCYPVTLNFDLWPSKSIGFQSLQSTKYIPSLVKIHWRILILVFTRMLCGNNLTRWPLTLKINRVPDSPRDYVCTKVGQNPLKDVDSSVQKDVTVRIWPWDIDLWPWKSTGFQTLQRTEYVPSFVKIHWRILILESSQRCYAEIIWPGGLWPWNQ